MVKIGDHAQCPQCNEIGRVVWVSQDGKRAGIQCPGNHTQMSRGYSKLGSTARPQTKRMRKMVFLIEIEMATTLVSSLR
jgi:hypothetical protein